MVTARALYNELSSHAITVGRVDSESNGHEPAVRIMDVEQRGHVVAVMTIRQQPKWSKFLTWRSDSRLSDHVSIVDKYTLSYVITCSM